MRNSNLAIQLDSDGPFSYGTAKSGVGISAMAILRPELMMKCTIPVVMAGIIAVSCSDLGEFFKY